MKVLGKTYMLRVISKKRVFADSLSICRQLINQMETETKKEAEF